MCVNCGCDGVTYPNGSDGVGIVSITDNENGTFTILMSDGSSFISPNYTGPTGPQGIQGVAGNNGINGTTVLFSQVARKYSVTNPPTTFTIDPTYLSVIGDSLRITFVHRVINTGCNLIVTATADGGSPETILNDGFEGDRLAKVEILLTRSELEPNTLKGYSLITSTVGNLVYSGITISDFLTATSNVISIDTDSSVEDSWYDTITVELLKAID